jgi:hypothetical protein
VARWTSTLRPKWSRWRRSGGCPQNQDALLAVHELAANAIEHASTGDDQLEAVSLELESFLSSTCPDGDATCSTRTKPFARIRTACDPQPLQAGPARARTYARRSAYVGERGGPPLSETWTSPVKAWDGRGLEAARVNTCARDGARFSLLPSSWLPGTHSVQRAPGLTGERILPCPDGVSGCPYAPAPKPSTRSGWIWMITRLSPGPRYGYLSSPRYFLASMLMCSSAPSSTIFAGPLTIT